MDTTSKRRINRAWLKQGGAQAGSLDGVRETLQRELAGCSDRGSDG
jgi:hypothetical protein